jgi:integrase
MAHVEDRWHKVDERGRRIRTERYGSGRRWRARWNDLNGRERSQSFDRRADAERHLVSVEADKARGVYIDPRAGRIRFEVYATEWLEGQTFDEATRERVSLHLRVHIFPSLGERDLSTIRPSHIQAWLRGLQQRLAASTIKVVFATVSSVLSAAVDDERVAKNPCKASTVKVPRPAPRKVIPWSYEQVGDMREALPAHYRMAVSVPAGMGLRQGEVFGLAVDDVDFLGRVVHIRRQVKILKDKRLFAPPKGRKTREVPLPEQLALELSAYLAAHPPVEVTLPWEALNGKPIVARLVMTTGDGTAIHRRYFDAKVWRPALEKAGLVVDRRNGMHALRHWYASVLLDGGESIKAVSEYLGHSDAGFTLRTYTHLIPSSNQRARKTIDRALQAVQRGGDGPEAAQEESR